MDKIGIFICYLTGATLFGIAAASVGTGLGYLVRGEVSSSSVSYFGIGVLVILLLYLINKFIKSRVGNVFDKSIKYGTNTGALIFMCLFTYFVLLGNLGNSGGA